MLEYTFTIVVFDEETGESFSADTVTVKAFSRDEAGDLLADEMLFRLNEDGMSEGFFSYEERLVDVG